MNLDSLTHTSGEWLRGSGPESDIVISSRIRLARNLAAFPFTNRSTVYQKAEIEALLRDRIAKLELDPKLGYVNVPTLSSLDRLVKGNAARLRARRIRLEMTMSDSGPVARSHSPLV